MIEYTVIHGGISMVGTAGYVGDIDAVELVLVGVNRNGKRVSNRRELWPVKGLPVGICFKEHSLARFPTLAERAKLFDEMAVELLAEITK